MRRSKRIGGAECAGDLLHAVADVIKYVGICRAVGSGCFRREVAHAFILRWNIRQSRLSPDDSCSFIVKEEERAILKNRPADISAELVLPIFGFLDSRAIKE